MTQQYGYPTFVSPRTATASLRFLLHFAQTNLETFRIGDWLNLSEDIQVSLQCMPITNVSGGHTLREPGFEDHIRALQALTRRMLDLSMQEPGHHDDAYPLSLQMSLQALPHPAACDTQGVQRPLLVGTISDLWSVLLWIVLNTCDMTKLACCPACKTIFYRRTNQDYCSRTCVNRISQRRWRARMTST